jgi:hypothetical protein
MTATNPSRGQYKLLAYVCGRSCVVYPDNIGTVDYTRIFVQRPSGCRYAVVEIWSIAKHAGEVLVFDLYDTLDPGGSKLTAPDPVGTYDDVDTAIMATAMLYEDD